ncbi:glutathione peroxidase [Aliidiomarina sp.]|uniref:glutathione peroxidase n=1 Tax=Aliidiomarina sp. TaxID=1872439 RepID=UPI003A4E03DB
MKNIVQNNLTMVGFTAPTAAKIAAYMLLLVLAAFASFNGHAQERSASNRAQFSQTEQGCLDTFNHSLRALHSTEQHDLCELTKDKVVLVVNTASQCGYTGQFADLEALYQEYQSQGLVILGFPSDSFRQEHADEAATADVCFRNFGVSFPMMATSSVTGNNANNIFKTLTQATSEAPGWNFHKYLISANGEQVTSFASAVKPTNGVIVKAVEELLKAR